LGDLANGAVATVEINVLTQTSGVVTNFAYVVARSEEHTSELQSHHDLVCRLLLEKKKKNNTQTTN